MNQLADRAEAAEAQKVALESENAALREQLEQAENQVTAARSRVLHYFVALGIDEGERGVARTDAKEPAKKGSTEYVRLQAQLLLEARF